MLPGRYRYLTVVDFGSFSLSGMVVRYDHYLLRKMGLMDTQKLSGLQVVACESVPSSGINRGAVTDITATTADLNHLIQRLEGQINHKIESIYVNVSSGFPKISILDTEYRPCSVITSEHLERLYRRALQQFYQNDNRYILHALPIEYNLDGVCGVQNIIGMRADQMHMKTLFVTADLPPLRNLAQVVDSCYLKLAGRIITPYSAALGTLTEDERQGCTICIDMGAGSTAISVFQKGHLHFADILKLGGHHITSDLARVLSIPYSVAEILKITRGAALYWSSDEIQENMIEIPVSAQEHNNVSHIETIPREYFIDIIDARLEEICFFIRATLEKANIDNPAGYRIVLTGGSSLLTGISDYMKDFFKVSTVRIGKNLRFSGLKEADHKPQNSVLAGMVYYALLDIPEISSHLLVQEHSKISRFWKNMVAWVEEKI